MFAPVQVLRNWHEQRPSSHSDLDLSVTEMLRESVTQPVFALIFVPKYVIVVGLRFKLYTLK
jgi:hypothetical protein